ncbi:MAG TPA: hypothetical protein PKC30_06620 [Saprospiraceae bacterium]|nr:hypothetical protein [Saprospiraceae bacterium]
MSALKYLVYDVTPVHKPRNPKADFSDTFSWPRVFHLSWIMLNEEFKPLQDFDCIVKAEGWKLDDKVLEFAGVAWEEVERKADALDDILNQFAQSIENVNYIIAHNMDIQEKVIAAEFLRRGIKHNLFKTDRICLMQEGTYYCKIPSKTGGFKWPTLRELHATLFNQAYTPAGNARADVIAASRCFIKLMKSGALEDLFDA